jgi:leader peptidase (prepilin peptidase)/N-methyltransferase
MKIGDFFRAPLAPYRPRLSFVHAFRVEPDPDRAWDRVASGQVDLVREVVLDRSPAEPTSRSSAQPLLVARLADDLPERVVVEVTSTLPGFLVLTDLWYPGWIAEADGKPVEIQRADGYFRAVPLAAERIASSFVIGSVRLRRRRHFRGGDPGDGVRRGGPAPKPEASCDGTLAEFGLWGAAVAGIAGLIVGSFLNVLVHRLPQGSRWCFRFALSFMWLRDRALGQRSGRLMASPRGRCRVCRAPIALRYPVIELSNGLLWFLLARRADSWLEFGAGAFLCSACLALLAIDAEFQILPDKITLTGIVVGLALSLLGRNLKGALIGVAVGAGGLYLLAFLYERVAGREGMGLGDVKMLRMIGAFLRPTGVLLTVLLASIAAEHRRHQSDRARRRRPQDAPAVRSFSLSAQSRRSFSARDWFISTDHSGPEDSRSGRLRVQCGHGVPEPRRSSSG